MNLYEDDNFIINNLDGIKVILKENAKIENCIVKFFNNENNNLIFEITINRNMWCSPNYKFYVPWRIEIYNNNNLLLNYNLDLKNKKVLILFESSALGDTLYWLPYIEEFRLKHQCDLSVNILINNEYLVNLIRENFEKKDINIFNKSILLDLFHSVYRIGCYDNDLNRNKLNWRELNLQQIATEILGLKFEEKRLIPFDWKIGNKIIKEKYIVFAPNSTLKAKLWNYKDGEGWNELAKYFKSQGFRTIQIGKEKNIFTELEDFTTEDLERTINLIFYSELFIGLGSGLSALAFHLNKKTIMISGFSAPWCEFQSNIIRIHNNKVCNSCFNDIKVNFERGNWNWCPYKRNFECTRKITTLDIINEIKKELNFLK